MKTLRTFIPLTLALALSGILVQCKKDNEKKPACNLITVTTAPNGTPIHLTYNADGKLSRAVSTNSVIAYEYTPSSATIVTTNSGNFGSKTIATLNNDGLAINVRTENDSLGNSWSNTFYEYNGQELSKSTLTTSAGGPAMVTTYTWVNQNLVLLTTDASSQVFGYYSNKLRQTGDYLLLVQQLQGYEIYRNKNLFKSLDAVNLNYEFGTDGRINSLSVTSGATESFIIYEYQCE
jgi:YD repeat-containing protein